MFLTLITSSPALAFAWILAILSSLTIHEFSHALIGKLKGDKTAEYEGRLSLNPLAHIDWMGFFMLLIVGFGWAKPVPFNPYNLKDPKWDSVAIALAGPISNLIVAIISSVVFRISIASLGALNLLSIFFFLLIILNLSLMFFNLIPIHPLDGSKLFFALFDQPKYAALREFVAVRGPQILMVAVFISLLTSINVFFFVSRPAFAVCNTLIGASCNGYFASVFSLI